MSAALSGQALKLFLWLPLSLKTRETFPLPYECAHVHTHTPLARLKTLVKTHLTVTDADTVLMDLTISLTALMFTTGEQMFSRKWSVEVVVNHYIP